MKRSIIRVDIGAPLDDRLRQFCDYNGISYSEWVRRALWSSLLDPEQVQERCRQTPVPREAAG